MMNQMILSLCSSTLVSNLLQQIKTKDISSSKFCPVATGIQE